MTTIAIRNRMPLSKGKDSVVITRSRPGKGGHGMTDDAFRRVILLNMVWIRRTLVILHVTINAFHT